MRSHLFGSNNISEEEFNSYKILPLRGNSSEIQGSSEKGVDGLDEFLALPKARSIKLLKFQW